MKKLLLCLSVGILAIDASEAALYTPQSGWNFGNLELTHNSGQVSGVLNHPGSFTDTFVIYIDSVAGGFSTTAGFTDNAGVLRSGASGLGTSGRSIVNFAQGFMADYALVLRPASSGVGLYKLANGAEFEQVTDPWLRLEPMEPNYTPQTFRFSWEAIGVTPSSGFNFQTTYVTEFGSRNRDSFETYTGTLGYSTINFDYFNVYGTPVPEMTNLALAIFGGLGIAVAVFRKRFI